MPSPMFPEAPLVGSLSTPEQAARLGLEPASAEEAGWFGGPKPWQHTEHQIGYIAPPPGGVDALPILGATDFPTDSSLIGGRVDIRLDRLRVAEYPGGNQLHEVLVTFKARNAVAGVEEIVAFSQAFDVQQGQSAGVRGFPVFTGLSVGPSGVALHFATVNVRNSTDEKILALLKSDAVKGGLGLLTAAQPAVQPLAGLALGVGQMVLTRSRNVKVQDVYLGLDFDPQGAGVGLASGTFVVVQVPKAGTIDWSKWRFVRSREQIEDEEGSGLPYNYLLFRVTRHAEPLVPERAHESLETPLFESAPTSRASGQVEPDRLVACCAWARGIAPEVIDVAAFELTAAGEELLATAGPIMSRRTEIEVDGIPTTLWTATVPVKGGTQGRAFRLHVSGSDPLVLGGRIEPVMATEGAALEFPTGENPLASLRALCQQQPDGGLALLKAMMPSADPTEIRALLDGPTQEGLEAVWPLSALSKPDIDADALAAFVSAYGLQHLGLDVEAAQNQKFQTREDWFAYLTTSGGTGYHAGGRIERPRWIDGDPDRLTYDVRPGDVAGDGLTVALFADFGNGTHAARGIADQLVRSRLPYAFHLGDIYYGGSQREVRDFFEVPLAPMLDWTELFLLAGNHEMYAGGKWFQDLVARKNAERPRVQRQVAESFRLRGAMGGHGFQVLGLDTMFGGSGSRQPRLHQVATREVLDLLERWLAERPDDLTVLLTSDHPWDLRSRGLTPLYESLREVIAGRVDLWFWGNVHYSALFEPWAFRELGGARRTLVGSCVGHGGYPFYRQTAATPLPEGLRCRWFEDRWRFWPDEGLRKDMGLNGWCAMRIGRSGSGWEVGLTYKDWVGRDVARATLARPDGGSTALGKTEVAEIGIVGGPTTWRVLP